STSARITRATPGQPTIEITRMMFPIPAPSTAARMITSGNPGITRMTSENRIRPDSTLRQRARGGPVWRWRGEELAREGVVLLVPADGPEPHGGEPFHLVLPCRGGSVD